MKRFFPSTFILLGVVLALVTSAYIVFSQPPQQAQAARSFTFVNNTAQTIWVGAHSNDNQAPPDQGGWELAPGATYSITLPEGWAGRFWGRTGCTFDGEGNGFCETGDCVGRLHCNGATGKLPATLAEFKLNGYGDLDFYDISLVDGYNLPMAIRTNGGSTTGDPYWCGEGTCMNDLNLICPAELQVRNASGSVVACNSACTAFGTDQYCCVGAYNSTEACNPAQWPVNYAGVFKQACPLAYSYAYDDATSTFACKDCSYTIAFGASSSDAPPMIAAPTPTPASTPTPMSEPTPTPASTWMSEPTPTPTSITQVISAAAESGDCPADGFTQSVTNSGSTSARPTFKSCSWSAGYVILHYIVPGLPQQNVQMTRSVDANTWEYDVSGMSPGQQISYQFTYQKDGAQYDTPWYTWSSP